MVAIETVFRRRKRKEELGSPVPQGDHVRCHVAIARDPGEPKVTNLEPPGGGIVQEIAWLDVAVNEPVGMAEFEGAQQLEDQGFGLGQRKGRRSATRVPMTFASVFLVGIKDVGQIVSAVLKDQKYIGLSDLDSRLRNISGLYIFLATVIVVIFCTFLIIAIVVVKCTPFTVAAAHSNFQQVDNVGVTRTDSEGLDLPQCRDRESIGGLVVGVAFLEGNNLVASLLRKRRWSFTLLVIAIAINIAIAVAPAVSPRSLSLPRIAGAVDHPVSPLPDSPASYLAIPIRHVRADAVIQAFLAILFSSLVGIVAVRLVSRGGRCVCRFGT